VDDKTYEIRVRYGECDQQGIVFNANYLVYVDDVMDRWLTAALGGDYGRFDYMVKRACVEWDGPARHRDVLQLSPEISRWGNSSFDITVAGRVGERPVFTATLLCVSVEPGTATPCRVPDRVRDALSWSTGNR
jgi:acyl-CoA thioester hydrolase